MTVVLTIYHLIRGSRDLAARAQNLLINTNIQPKWLAFVQLLGKASRVEKEDNSILFGLIYQLFLSVDESEKYRIDRRCL